MEVLLELIHKSNVFRIVKSENKSNLLSVMIEKFGDDLPSVVEMHKIYSKQGLIDLTLQTFSEGEWMELSCYKAVLNDSRWIDELSSEFEKIIVERY